MTELYIGGVAASLAIIAVVEALKRAFLPSKWAFLAAIVLGIGGGIAAAFSYGELSLLEGIVLGTLSGGAAAGFYSGTKAMSQSESENK